MRYKYSMPARIRNIAEWHFQRYPQDARELEQEKNDQIPSPTPAYSLSVGGAQVSRSTENVAVRIMSSPYVKRLEANVAAVEKALAAGDALDRRLIELVYFKQEYTVPGAATRLNISVSGAYKRVNNMLIRLALELGYVNE